MKRTGLLAVAAAAALVVNGLCACGGGEGEKERSEASGAVLPDSVDPETGAWKGQGGCYRTEPFDTSDYAAVLHFRQGEMYYIGWKSPGDCRLYRGDRELVKTGGHFLDFCMAAEGLWLLEEEREDQRFFARLRLYSYEGEPLRDLRVELPADGHLQDLGIGEGVLYLNCSSCVLACDAEGALLAAIPHAEWEGRLLLGGDGAVYFLDQRENGGGTLRSGLQGPGCPASGHRPWRRRKASMPPATWSQSRTIRRQTGRKPGSGTLRPGFGWSGPFRQARRRSSSPGPGRSGSAGHSGRC